MSASIASGSKKKPMERSEGKKQDGRERQETSSNSEVVAGIPGYAAIAFISDSKFDESETEQCKPPVKKLRLGETSNARKNAQLIRSYGTFAHLVQKTLNAVLAEVETSNRIDGADVVKVGATGYSMVAALYIESAESDLNRSLCIVLDTNRRRDDIDSTAMVRYSLKNTMDFVVGCTCRDETLETSCDVAHRVGDVHTKDFTMNTIHLSWTSRAPFNTSPATPRYIDVRIPAVLYHDEDALQTITAEVQRRDCLKVNDKE